MLVRVRSNVGIWRIDDLNETTAMVSDVLDGIRKTRPDVIYEKELSLDPGCTTPINTTIPLHEQNVRHGSMIYCRVDSTSCTEVMVSPQQQQQQQSSSSSSSSSSATGAKTTATTTATAQAHATQPKSKKRVIIENGIIKTTQDNMDGKDKGFRKGMLPLRDIKMHWTINEFMALDAQYTFKIKRQEQSTCTQVSLDASSVHDFQSYLQRFDFSRKRMGYLYGKYVVQDQQDNTDQQPNDDATNNNKQTTEDDKKPSASNNNQDDSKQKQPPKTKTIVEAIYEPPQEIDTEAAEGFVLLEDPMEQTVDEIASLLGLTKVGWIFAHPPGREQEQQLSPDDDNALPSCKIPPYVLSSAEILMAAEYQLEAAQGIQETPFVTVKVTKGADGNVSVEAFQVSQQCMEMAAEEALDVGPHPERTPHQCTIQEKFTAIQEGKESSTVDTHFFVTVVPIVQHSSQQLVSMFPKPHRPLDDRIPSHDEMKQQLKKSGTSGWTFIDLLSDFHLLLYLSQFLDLHSDLSKICQSIVDKSIPLDDGYKIIITSMAGMDQSY